MHSQSRFRRALALIACSGVLVAVMVGASSAGQAPGDAGPATTDALLHYFEGVRLGMAPSAVHDLLGQPSDKAPDMDLYKLSKERRLRVYYDAQGVKAVVSTYIGTKSGAPSAISVLGESLEPSGSGSRSGSLRRPEEGYSLVYSVVSGDDPMVLLTMQKL